MLAVYSRISSWGAVYAPYLHYPYTHCTWKEEIPQIWLLSDIFLYQLQHSYINHLKYSRVSMIEDSHYTTVSHQAWGGHHSYKAELFSYALLQWKL